MKHSPTLTALRAYAELKGAEARRASIEAQLARNRVDIATGVSCAKHLEQRLAGEWRSMFNEIRELARAAHESGGAPTESELQRWYIGEAA